ncbi:MAG: AAA family ATPase [Rhodoglobus sp.]
MPILHLLAGPNGSGKSTFVERVLQPTTHLLFVNADVIARQRWPEAQEEHAYAASEAASSERERLLGEGASFITETVFSHPSKLELVEKAVSLHYLVHLHVILLPVEVAVARVNERVLQGGHSVPERKIRERYDRLWDLVARARVTADRSSFYDNSKAENAFNRVARYEHGLLIGEPDWPAWTPSALTA